MVGPFRFTATRIVATEGADGPETVVELEYRIGTDTDAGADSDGGAGVTVFTEKVTFPFPLPDTKAVQAAVRVLHLVAGVSYYKSAAPTPLHVGDLSPAERDLVVALYDHGLREMAYRNGIEVPLPVDLVIDADQPIPGDSGPTEDPAPTGEDARTPSSNDGDRPKALIPIGGGKDSALVAALIPDGTLLAVNAVGAQWHLAEALGRPLVAVRRTMDPALRDLVARGVQNGHVPVTAITSAISVLVALALDLDDVAMGIERSADEPTVITADGVAVNHQYSKSTGAEGLLRAVFDPLGVRYFSLLRPLSELGIGAAVARRGLTGDIVSCNRVFTVWNESTASREQRPCGECAKCLFTALMLAPAAAPDDIARAYGGPLLDRVDHVEAVRDLWSDEKPFDCVGERLETAAAVDLLAAAPLWRDQAVVRALAGEAEQLLAEAEASPADYLDLEGLERLPPEYQPLVAELDADLASVSDGRASR